MDEERDGDGETLEATGERSVAIDLLETAAGPAARSGRMAGEIGEGTVRGLQGRGTAETVVRATSGAGAERISRVASQVTVARSTPSSASRGASWTSAGAEEERRVETLPGDPLEWAAPTVMVKLGSETEARIGRFAVLRKLGEGGMGAVYSAYDEELDRRVAIKVVRGALAGDTLGHARMQREAQAMARLSHPNVVQVYDVGMHAGELFIAMEFVRGVTLERWEEAIDRGSEAGIGEIVAMYRQAGEGLAAAHAVGLVHRDFKPENVLVGEDGRARVLDFGIAAASGAEGAPRGREGRSGGGGGGGCWRAI
jgi:predicted Ser/Thr protein kinase